MAGLLIFFLGFFLGIFIDLAVAFFSGSFSKKREIKHFTLNGMIFHHSLIGAILLILSIFYYKNILSGLGLGIILSHSWREHGLLFIGRASFKGQKI